MKRLNALFILSILAISSASAQGDAQVRKELESSYAKLTKAFKSKDVKTIFAMGTNDFSYVAKNKTKMDRKSAEAMITGQMKMIQEVQTVSNVIKKLTVKGDTAIAIVTGTVKGKMINPGQQGKTLALVSIGDTKDTWIKTSKGWKLKSVEVLSDKTTLDGKPVG